MSENKIAPEGFEYVCNACGKRSKDKYGDQAINRGWDVSCIMHAAMYPVHELIIDKDTNRVVGFKEGETHV